MKEKILELSDLFFDEIVSIRRYMHMHPELSFQEFETSNYIKSILKSWDIKFLDGCVPIKSNLSLITIKGSCFSPFTKLVFE